MCPRLRQGAIGAEFAHPHDAAALLCRARALDGVGVDDLNPLSGRRLALLSSDPNDDAGRTFVQAATALGAHVSIVSPGLDESSSVGQIETLARFLGRLYDAAECHRLPDSVIARIARSAGVPVFAGLATAGHPTARMAAELSNAPIQFRRLRIVQAALLLSVA